MQRYDKIMIPVAISEYQKQHEKQCSLPILSPTGLVNQMFFFDCKGYDEKGYKALQEQKNVIVLTVEEAANLWNAAHHAGMQDAGAKLKKPAVDFETYLQSKGIQI